VPRDWDAPSTSTRLTLFARAARRIHAPADPATQQSSTQQLPWLLYLQGGPGFGCASPQHNGWTNSFVDRGYQVLCLDQRGTGLSTPLTASTLQLRGDEDVQAQYLRSFRADSIVKDAEAVRATLTDGLPEASRRWSIMGQSYGGFCCVTYLSQAAHGVREAFVLGGLPPLQCGPDEVYERIFKRLVKRNAAYYNKFADDVGKVQRIVTFLQRFGNTGVRDTSDNGFLTARRFMQLGLYFGFHGGLDVVHGKFLLDGRSKALTRDRYHFKGG
jgi:pimeloyl-ACP methyl ester carboxylesterase